MLSDAKPAAPDNWNYDTTIKKGVIWPYCGNSLAIWHCPGNQDVIWMQNHCSY
jgi:hypothetical protein